MPLSRHFLFLSRSVCLTNDVEEELQSSGKEAVPTGSVSWQAKESKKPPLLSFSQVLAVPHLESPSVLAPSQLGFVLAWSTVGPSRRR